jgi:cytochrome bd-type quinol oxidase subunit 2
VFFAAVGLLFVLFGLGDIASGGSTYDSGEAVLFHAFTGTTWSALQTADPGAARLIDVGVRLGGVYFLVTGVLILATSAIAMRRGERWAWLVMWALPLMAGAGLAILLFSPRAADSGVPVPIFSGSIVLVLSLAVLVLSAPRYLRAS